jgi:hypothetical protein
MTFPKNSQLTVVSAVTGVTAVTIVVIPAVVGVSEVPHVSADVAQPVVVDVLPAFCVYGVFAVASGSVPLMLLISLLFLL